MVFKSATHSQPKEPMVSADAKEEEPAFEDINIVWDLSKNFAEEDRPDDIARCIKFSLMAKNKRLTHIPKFEELYRDGVLIKLAVHVPRLRLRDVIGKSGVMLKIGK